jgi:hypothetical protein
MMNNDCIFVETPGGPRKIIVDSFLRRLTVFLLSSSEAKAVFDSLCEMFAAMHQYTGNHIV